jgi:hypothetical protein
MSLHVTPHSCRVVLYPPNFFPRCEEHKRGEQNARNAGDPGGAAEQDRGGAGQHQRGDEAGREASHRHGEVVRPLCLSLEQVPYIATVKVLSSTTLPIFDHIADFFFVKCSLRITTTIVYVNLCTHN